MSDPWGNLKHRHPGGKDSERTQNILGLVGAAHCSKLAASRAPAPARCLQRLLTLAVLLSRELDNKVPGAQTVPFYFYFFMLGINPRALHMLGTYPTTELHPPTLF